MANDRVWPEPLAVRYANRQSHGKSAGNSSRHGRMEDGNWMLGRKREEACARPGLVTSKGNGNRAENDSWAKDED